MSNEVKPRDPKYLPENKVEEPYASDAWGGSNLDKIYADKKKNADQRPIIEKKESFKKIDFIQRIEKRVTLVPSFYINIPSNGSPNAFGLGADLKLLPLSIAFGGDAGLNTEKQIWGFGRGGFFTLGLTTRLFGSWIKVSGTEPGGEQTSFKNTFMLMPEISLGWQFNSFAISAQGLLAFAFSEMPGFSPGKPEVLGGAGLTIMMGPWHPVGFSSNYLVNFMPNSSLGNLAATGLALGSTR